MTYEPELGQSIFGAKWEESLVPDRVAEYLASLAEDVLELLREDSSMPSYGAEFENDIFEMHPYNWDGCACGQAEKECAWYDANPHKSSCFSLEYEAKEAGVKAYLTGLGYTAWTKPWVKRYETIMTAWAKKKGYPHGMEGIATHCDCGQQQAWDTWAFNNPHDPKCREVLPNFRVKKTGWAIHWYKYIGRGMSANVSLDRKAWKGAIDACRDSLRRKS